MILTTTNASKTQTKTDKSVAANAAARLILQESVTLGGGGVFLLARFRIHSVSSTAGTAAIAAGTPIKKANIRQLPPPKATNRNMSATATACAMIRSRMILLAYFRLNSPPPANPPIPTIRITSTASTAMTAITANGPASTARYASRFARSGPRRQDLLDNARSKARVVRIRFRNPAMYVGVVT